ncbi:MAG: hypothetical protein ABIS23_05730 [Sphingomicrobium sp.]
MTLGELVLFSKDLSNWIGGSIDNAELRWAPNIQLSGACFQVGLSHHAAIVHLVDADRYASALALLRPLMECFLRGVWINRVATEEQLERFLRGGDLKIDQIIADIEATDVFDEGRITEIKREVWSDFCDFTHCGGKTIRSHFRGDELTPNFSEAYLKGALMSANAWALTTGLWVAILADNINLAETFLARAKTLNSVVL